MNACNSISLDLDAVPRAVRDDLARTLALAVDAYFKQPGVEEKFQAWLAERKKRQKAEAQPDDLAKQKGLEAMTRLKANKTSLYKLVEKYEALPGIRRTSFVKVSRRPDYFLRWETPGGQHAEAFFTASIGRPTLAITVMENGKQLSRVVHHPALDELRDRGMVEEFTSAMERRRANSHA